MWKKGSKGKGRGLGTRVREAREGKLPDSLLESCMGELARGGCRHCGSAGRLCDCGGRRDGRGGGGRGGGGRGRGFGGVVRLCTLASVCRGRAGFACVGVGRLLAVVQGDRGARRSVLDGDGFTGGSVDCGGGFLTRHGVRWFALSSSRGASRVARGGAGNLRGDGGATQPCSARRCSFRSLSSEQILRSREKLQTGERPAWPTPRNASTNSRT